jgi:hypothetical protein
MTRINHTVEQLTTADTYTAFNGLNTISVTVTVPDWHEPFPIQTRMGAANPRTLELTGLLHVCKTWYLNGPVRSVDHLHPQRPHPRACWHPSLKLKSCLRSGKLTPGSLSLVKRMVRLYQWSHCLLLRNATGGWKQPLHSLPLFQPNKSHAPHH